MMQASTLAWSQLGHIELAGGEIFSVLDHPFQIDWLDDDAPDQCFKKGAQIGATEIQIFKTLHGMITKRFRQGALYLFPTADDVTDFSKGRFNPLIENNYDQIGRYVQSTDAANIKRINEAMLYLRGARPTKKHAGIKKTSTKLKSIPVDRLVFDEKDEMDPAMIRLAQERTAHSRLNFGFGEQIALSTPTIPDYGIDKDYQESDQRVWQIKCQKCNTYTCLELEFPNCIAPTEKGNALRLCKKCRQEIHPGNGIWVPQYPGKDKVGWWASQLISPRVNPRNILDAFNDPPDGDLSEVYNSKLGMAYIAAENRLTQNQVFACCGSDPMDVRFTGATGMGVDVGKILHVVIGSIPFKGGIRIRKMARVSSFNDVYDLAKQFNVRFTVFDLEPETRKVREYRAMSKHPVYGCDYNEHQRGAWAWNDRDGVVVVNRTEICDATHNLVDQTGRLEIPRKDAEVEEYAKEMCNIAKVLETDEETGSKAYRYRKLGADHYRHATNYLFLACEQLGVTELVRVSPTIPPAKYKYD